jgi:protein-S-isoprenylcysteine O-methyltransferase Ste14
MSYYLLLFIITYFLVSFVLPTWRVRRQTGVNPFVVPNDDSPLGFIGKIFRLIILLTVTATIVHAFVPDWSKFLLPFWYLETDSLRWLGWLLLHGSLVWIVVAQWHMKKSWRIGIDEKNRTELVTSGLFRYSRNPVFLGMLTTMAGLFLVLPNALTLLAQVVTWTVLQLQVRLEEEFLQKTHGEDYLRYCRKVRRWL